MGNRCWTSQTAPVVECIQQLQRVEKTLQNLINKYAKQVKEQKTMARGKMYDKTECLQHIRKIKLIQYHKENMEKRLTNCMSKRYQLESLNVTKMHIDKVAKMQDTLCGMIEDACEINEVLNETNVDMDESEIEEEYEALYAEIQLPTVPTTSLMYESMETNFEEIPLTLTS